MIFHISTIEEFEKAKLNGIYEPSSLQTDGFIHCASPDQVKSILDRYFQDLPQVVIFEVDQSKITCPIVYENSHGRATMYPHIYGAIPFAAIVNSRQINPADFV